jgi:hypothetical protein
MERTSAGLGRETQKKFFILYRHVSSGIAAELQTSLVYMEPK